MEGWFGAVIFIVIVIASIAQKIQERRASKRASKPLTRDDIPEEARRRLYGDSSTQPRVAKPKGAEAARPMGQEAVREARPAQRVEPPPIQPPGKELFDSLFGGGAAELAGEPQQPVPSPAPDRVPASPTAQQQSREVRVPPPSRAKQTAARTPQRKSAGQPQPRQVEPADRAAARQGQRGTQRPKKAARQVQPRPPSRIAPPAGPLALFTSVNDVRRGIILAEVLGPPKALREGS